MICSYVIFFFTILFYLCYAENKIKHEGRYTRDIHDYELVVPQKVNEDGSFLTYSLPHFYERFSGDRRKRQQPAIKVHYALHFNGDLHHIELEPNYGLLSPAMVVESKRNDVRNSKFTPPKPQQCHFVGIIRGHRNSRAAISLCEGMAGYMKTENGDLYFIEPAKDSEPERDGRHHHLIYRQLADNPWRDRATVEGKSVCGVKDSDGKKAWADRFRHEYETNPHFDGKRASAEESLQRYVEVFLVADKKFITFHKEANRDPEDYLLTIMNMVSDYYHDASVGNMIDINLVRLMYLDKEEEEFDLQISPDAEGSLENFAKWQKSLNPPEEHPNHHDIAVLITRHDICSDNMTECGLMGIAFIGEICNTDKSSCMCEDSGLMLAPVVTHEMGHVFGMLHDKIESDCEAKDENGANHVMSPSVMLNTVTFSTCSSTFITELFSYGLGECLLDEPHPHEWNFPNMLPGAMYDGDAQCKFSFKADFPACKMSADVACKKLYCLKNNECRTRFDPPLDGTNCGNQMWCYLRECVPQGTTSIAVNGGWGDWGPASECSRTCGGGMSVIQRKCDNPQPSYRGKYCLGDRNRYSLCNTDPCPKGDVPFLDYQCAQWNDVVRRGEKHTWTAFTEKKNANPCSLVCINENNIYAVLSTRVIDGTNCKAGTKNKCISGVCRTVGCDDKIDSDKVEDKCLECDGDGTSCKLVEDTYLITSGRGYEKVTTIPKDSRNILVEELGASKNLLSVSDENNSYFLNGENVEQPPGEYDFGGVIGVYSTPEMDKEQLAIRGPTTVNLVISYAWYSGIKNPGVKYSYYTPVSKSSVPKYSWELLDWSECSVLCGGGTQEAVPSCVEEHGGKVSGKYCQNMSKPETRSRVCNKNSCPTKWRVDVWGQCCLSDTGVGMQNRAVKCVQEPQKAGEDDVIVEDKLCKEKKPLKSQKCSNATKCRKSRQTPRFKSPAHLISNLVQVKDLYDGADSNEQKPFVSEHKNARNINEHRLLSYWKLSALENKVKDNYSPMNPEKEEEPADWGQEQSDYDQQDYEGDEPGPATNNEFVEYKTDENHNYVGPARPEDHMDEGLDDNYSEVHYDNFSPSFWEKLPSPHSPYRQGNPDKSSMNPQHSYFTVEAKGTENTAKQVKRESEQRKSLAQTPFEGEDESLSVSDEYTDLQPDQPTPNFRDRYISNGHLLPSMLSQAHELRGNMYDAGEVSALQPHTFERGDNVIQLLSPAEQYWVDRDVRDAKTKPLRNILDSKRRKNVLSIPHKHYWDIGNSRTVKRANDKQRRYGSGRYRKTKEPTVSIDENLPPIVEVIPLVKNPEALDLSDEAKEQLGDKVLGMAEKLIPDTQNAKNVTGYEAKLKLEENLTK